MPKTRSTRSARTRRQPAVVPGSPTSDSPAPDTQASGSPDPLAALLPAGTPATLPLASLDPSRFNTRRFRPDEESNRELTASIRVAGVLEPILVRPAGDRFEILAGERRYRCAVAAGREEAPCVVFDVDDALARLIVFTENHHRQDLHFLEEADAVAGMLGDGWSPQDVADRTGRSASWVARRARLRTLSPEIRAAIDDPEHPLSGWGAGHFEELAPLDPETQDQVIASLPHYQLEAYQPADLRQAIASITHRLDRAPWKLDDEGLVPEAGACSRCPLRSSCEPLLFPDLEDPEGKAPTRRGSPDRCLKPTCWQQKEQALVDRKFTELASRHPEAVRLTDFQRQDAIPSYRVRPARKKDDGAVPALLVDGPELGKVRWVQLPPRVESTTSSRGSAPVETPAGPRKTSLAVRKLRLQARRQLRAIEGLTEAVEKSDTYPPLPGGAALAVVFGTLQTNSCGWHVHDPVMPEPPADAASTSLWDCAHAFAGTGPESLATSLWERVRPVLLARLRTNERPEDAGRAFAEATHLARLCGLDAADYLAKATEALPDPKSWAAEEAAERRAGGADSSSAGIEEDPAVIDSDEISDDEDESDAA